MNRRDFLTLMAAPVAMVLPSAAQASQARIRVRPMTNDEKSSGAFAIAGGRYEGYAVMQPQTLEQFNGTEWEPVRWDDEG